MTAHDLASALFSSFGTGSLRWKKRRVISALRDIYQMDAAFISRFSLAERLFDEVVLSPIGDPLPLARGMAGPLETSYCHRIAERQVPCLLTDARTHPGVADIPQTHVWPIGAHVSVPITLSNGTIHGMLCGFSRRPQPELTARDVAFFALFADLLARDIEDAAGPEVDLDATADLLHRAIAHRAFRFFLQPILSLPDRTVTGYELLTRFPADLGRTEQIFRAAHALDLIALLEEVIVQQAARLMTRLPRATTLSINLSVGSVETLDLAAILPPEDRCRIIIEITEHERVADYDSFARAVARLREQGFRLAIDDVGAGYSSFRHVIQLKPEIIKIDRSLISGIDHSAERGSLATALHDYSALHNVRIIAEGVETPEELAKVIALGIPYGQGYALGRPAPADEVL